MLLHAREFHPPQGVLRGDLLASNMNGDLGRTGLQRGGRIIETGRATAQHRHALTGQAGEINRVLGVRAQLLRQILHHLRQEWPAATVQAQCEDHAARAVFDLLAAALRRDAEIAVRLLRRVDPRDEGVEIYIDASNPPVPDQVLMPVQPWHQLRGIPCFLAILRLKPRLRV